MTLGCITRFDCGSNSRKSPFASFAHEQLESRYPGAARITSVGHMGWNALQMAPDLQQTLDRLGSARPDVVLITAGGNDWFHWLANSTSPPTLPDAARRDQVMADMRALHAVAHRAGSKTIALSYPRLQIVRSLGPLAGHELEEFNQRIKYESGADAFIDLDALLPAAEVKANRWQSSDKVHFTREGNRQLADASRVGLFRTC